ncbi:hypothetical protein [Nocardiopsis sp. B62]|uniref:hypothetical protein n=1 Tax=Nocardiopsis sp. B62 TaxID=2824874 RepID=UPI001B39B03F|nr:hypothetical protein [Nocardiopsis sp. B62]MBQ1081777.1 hypothetical protein [Nocardiopsis sp. B62]
MNRHPSPSASAPHGVSWPLVLSLGALALVRPLMNVTGITEAIGSPWAQLSATLLVTLAWVTAVLVAQVPRPFLTLVCAGVAYGVLAILLSAVLSPLLGEGLQGPLTNPFTMVSVLAVNAVWGAVAGGLALVVGTALGRGSGRVSGRG